MRRVTISGFTLIEILAVVAIALLLMAILIPVIANAKRQAMNVSSKGLLNGLTLALNNYQLNYNSYPIKPGGHGLDGVTEADFYQTPCAPLGQASTGTEDNSALVELLHQTAHFDYKQSNWVNGRLVDDFGSPVIIRFLTVSSGGQLEVKVIVWSYGYDRKNGINAAPSYTFSGAPAYDQAEVNNIEAAIQANPDDLVVRH